MAYNIINNTTTKREFGKLFSLGIENIAAWRDVYKKDVELDIYDRYFITPDNLHKWYSGKIPDNPDSEKLEILLRFLCVEGRMSVRWIQRILELGKRLGIIINWETLIHELTKQTLGKNYPVPSPSESISFVSNSPSLFYITFGASFRD